MRAQLRTITLNRTGRIKVRVAGDNHCGHPGTVSEDGNVPVQYTVQLTVDPGGLDSRGFLVDQEDLHNVMQDIGMDPVPWREPCELLAVVWGERLQTWIRTTNVKCTIHELRLTLSPAPHLGSFTAHFSESQLAPTAVVDSQLGN